MSLLWTLDASDSTKLFADTSKTTPITDGTGVAAVVTAGGLISTDALQSTSGNRPTYRANYSSSGYPALEFDGTNDLLSIAHSSGWNASVIDLFAVLTSTSNATGTYKGIFGKFGDGSWGTGWGATYTLGYLSFGSPQYTACEGTAILNSRIMCHFHFEALKNGCDQGGRYIGSRFGTGPSDTTADVMIGGAPGGIYPFAGAINEICFFGGGETDADILTTKNSLRSKWGLASVSTGTSRPSHPMYQQVIG